MLDVTIITFLSPLGREFLESESKTKNKRFLEIFKYKPWKTFKGYTI